MPRKAHTEEQIVAVLRQVEAGARVDEICRKVGISQATYYSGNGSIPVWESVNCVSCGSCEKRTDG